MTDFLQHVLNGVSAGTIYALVALGYTMVYGVLKLINFAHGDVMMVGVYVALAVATGLGVDARGTWWVVAVVFATAMAACALLGFAIEKLAYRPLREKPRLTSLITAIGVSFALSYGFQLDWSVEVFGHRWTLLPGSASRAFPEILAPRAWWTLGGEDHEIIIWNRQVISFAVALALFVALQWLVHRTQFGRAMRAVSHDHRIAALMGIPVDRIISLTFMLGSALAACAGILYAMKDTAVQPLMGMYIGLKAFVAAVVGGIGHLPGAVVGALTLGLCEEFIVGYTSSTWRDAVSFGFLIVVLLVRPSGLFGRFEPEKV